ncbi:MAG: coproporphyrinogen dehydrogenase HemZ [Christensenellales bacterium]
MVTLHTNLPQFYNDISECIRLFDPAPDILLNGAKGNVHIAHCFEETNGQWVNRASLSAAGNTFTYESVSPVFEGKLLAKKQLKRAVKCCVFRTLKQYYDKETPWGSLTGIRPSKLARELTLERGEEGARRMFMETFDVSPQKTELAFEIANNQKPFLESVTEQSADLYCSIPFCVSRCLYCSFSSGEITKNKQFIGPYLTALTQEIEGIRGIIEQNGLRLRSIYIGGGTPTSLCAKDLKAVLDALSWAAGGAVEFTVEAGRADTIDAEKLRVIKGAGATRISVNPQTMNAQTLETIGRNHTPQQVEEAFALARKYGFDNINMDVIAGLPNESPDMFEHTLSKIKEMNPESLTVHTLALKRASLLWGNTGGYSLPEGNVVARMVNDASACARSMAMAPYYMYRQKYMTDNLENVGYAKGGCESVYNVDMMEETATILAAGAGAMTKGVFCGGARIERVPNPKDIRTYIEKLPLLLEQKRALIARKAGNCLPFQQTGGGAF